MQSNIIQLYNKNKNKVGLVHRITERTFYIYSFKNFNIEIVKGNASIYSVVEKENEIGLLKEKSTSFSAKENFGYTIFLESSKCYNAVVAFRVWNDENYEMYYTLIFDINDFSETLSSFSE